MQLSSTLPQGLPVPNALVHYYYEPHKKIRCPHQSRYWLMTWGLHDDPTNHDPDSDLAADGL